MRILLKRGAKAAETELHPKNAGERTLMSELTSLLTIFVVVAVFLRVITRIKDPTFPAEGLGSLSATIRALFGLRRAS